MLPSNIHDYIVQQESDFETQEIQVGDNWSWSLRNHVQMIFHMVNSIFYKGENNWLRAFKQVMEPIIGLSAWTEDIEVKDVVFFITGQKGKALSFLLKKYHDEIYAKEHNLDEMIDDITEDDLTYGGVLVQKKKGKPEVLPLMSIAFADQTDLLGGPIGFKHYFSPDKLLAMSSVGWGKEENGANCTLQDLITLATYDKESQSLQEKKNKTPGKNIEVYIVKGNLPLHYLNDDDDMENFANQVQVVAFYTNKEGKKESAVIFRKKGDANIKFFTSKKVYLRGLGRGVGEMLLHPQVWTNFAQTHQMNLLEASSKIPLYTDDETYKTKNKIQDMENLEITSVQEGRRIFRVPNDAGANINLFEGSINTWFQHAQLQGAAFDPVLGIEATSGTTFRGQERTVAQGRGSHDRRRGKRAKFIEEIYRDWIIPEIVSEITSGKKFLSSLETDELNFVAKQFANKKLNDKKKEALFKMEIMTPEEEAELRNMYREEIISKGSEHLLEILKDEFKGIEVKIGINVANKQKNLADLSDKVLSIFQFIFSNPQAFQQAMQVPALSKAFGDILEFSGLSMGDFSTLLDANQTAIAPVEEQQQLSLATQDGQGTGE